MIKCCIPQLVLISTINKNQDMLMEAEPEEDYPLLQREKIKLLKMKQMQVFTYWQERHDLFLQLFREMDIWQRNTLIAQVRPTTEDYCCNLLNKICLSQLQKENRKCKRFKNFKIKTRRTSMTQRNAMFFTVIGIPILLITSIFYVAALVTSTSTIEIPGNVESGIIKDIHGISAFSFYNQTSNHTVVILQVLISEDVSFKASITAIVLITVPYIVLLLISWAQFCIWCRTSNKDEDESEIVELPPLPAQNPPQDPAENMKQLKLCSDLYGLEFRKADEMTDGGWRQYGFAIKRDEIVGEFNQDQ